MEKYQKGSLSQHDILIINCPQCRNENRIQFTQESRPIFCGCGYSVAFSVDQMDKTRQSIEILKQTLGDLAA